MARSDSSDTPIHLLSASPVTRFPAQSTRPGILGAHAHLIERLIKDKPFPIRLVADEVDLEDRKDHAERLIKAVEDYLGALIADTNQVSRSGQIERDMIEGYFADLTGDLCGAFQNAADAAREDHAA